MRRFSRSVARREIVQQLLHKFHGAKILRPASISEDAVTREFYHRKTSEHGLVALAS